MDTTPGASENQVSTVEKRRSLQKRSWKRSSTIDAFLGFFTDGLFCSFYLSLSRCAPRGRRKPKSLPSCDPLTQDALVRTDTFNEHKARIGFCCNSLSAFISHLICEWTVTNYRKLLQKLTTGNIEHDIVGQATCSWRLVLKEIPRIVLVDERAPKLLTERTPDGTLSTSRQPFQDNQPHCLTLSCNRCSGITLVLRVLHLAMQCGIAA